MRTACFLRKSNGIEVFVRVEEREMTGKLVDLERCVVLCGILQRKGDEKQAIKRSNLTHIIIHT
jgi:hypothetical protein